jgi:hypothetical protein
MSHSDTPTASQLVLLIVAALMLTIAVTVLVMAFDFEGGSGLFPRLIGWIFVGLTSAEFVLQIQRYRRSLGSQSADDSSAKAEARTLLHKELAGMSWLGAIVLGIYLVGFEVTAPVFLFSFIRTGGNSLKKTATITFCLSAVLYLLFVVLLGHKLYTGILFGA